MINTLPVLTTLPAIVMHSSAKLSTEIGRLSTIALRVWFIPALFVAIILFQTVFTARDILLPGKRPCGMQHTTWTARP
jgi:hypothetical protein